VSNHNIHRSEQPQIAVNLKHSTFSLGPNLSAHHQLHE
jgi:hypothetical protein